MHIWHSEYEIENGGLENPCDFELILNSIQLDSKPI